jgi:putative toxin-antitoxin system antitoxin component (TIGR02293 family)
MSVEVRDIAVVLGGERTLGVPVHQLRDLEQIVKNGMPFAAIENVFRLVNPNTTENEMHALVHMVFRPGDKRRYNQLQKELASFEGALPTKGTRVKEDEGVRAERLARIYALAQKALGDNRLASEFLFKPHAMLENSSPASKLDTEIGAREVEYILNAAIYGLAC